MDNQIYDVIIVGGGPSGLWLACELKLHGINVCILEKRKERGDKSRSLTIHGRTLEVFALRGLEKEFLAKGKPLPSWHFANLDTRLEFSGFESRHPFMLFIPQTETEKILESHATKLGVEIKRGYEVTHVVADEISATVYVSANDQNQTFSAKYLVGADGARSFVRASANIALEGVDAENSIMMGDVHIDFEKPEKPHTISNPKGGISFIPLGKSNFYRVICASVNHMKVDKPLPLTLEELSAAINHISGNNIKLYDARWLSRFTDETKIAQTYQKGRIILIGDAAHIHAPMGGQGLNVGIQDAMNLGWKLASTIKGTKAYDLLGSYCKERWPVGKRLAENTLAQSIIALGFDERGMALKSTIDQLLSHVTVNRELAGEVSGYDLKYPQPIFEDIQDNGGGIRIPDKDLSLANGVNTSIYTLLKDGKWLLLTSSWFDAKPPLSLGKEDIIITSTNGDQPIHNHKAILVRPDGYLAKVW